MSKQTQGSMAIVGSIAGGVFLVAIVALMVLGSYGFSPALFLAAGVALVVAIFLLVAFHQSSGPDEPTRLTARRSGPGTGAQAPAPQPHSASAATESSGSTPAPVMSTPSVAQSAPADEPAQPEGEVTVGTEPMRLDQPRDGGADDLKKIKGVGPKLEEALHAMGIYHLDQIASWSASEVAWMDENLVEFRGRVSRDDWVGQARHLAEGGDTDFSRRVEDGEVYH